MKKQFLIIAIICSMCISCENDDVETNQVFEKKALIEDGFNFDDFRIVSESDYDNAELFEQTIYDKINATVRALSSLKNYEEMEAVISVSRNEKNYFSNSIIICMDVGDGESLKKAGNCKVCGVISAYKCLAKMQKEIKAQEFNIHVKRTKGCVKLSWK